MLQTGYMGVRNFTIIDVVSVILKVVTDSRRSVRDITVASVTDKLLTRAAGGGVDSMS